MERKIPNRRKRLIREYTYDEVSKIFACRKETIKKIMVKNDMLPRRKRGYRGRPHYVFLNTDIMKLVDHFYPETEWGLLKEEARQDLVDRGLLNGEPRRPESKRK